MRHAAESAQVGEGGRPHRGGGERLGGLRRARRARAQVVLRARLVRGRRRRGGGGAGAGGLQRLHRGLADLPRRRRRLGQAHRARGLDALERAARVEVVGLPGGRAAQRGAVLGDLRHELRVEPHHSHARGEVGRAQELLLLELLLLELLLLEMLAQLLLLQLLLQLLQLPLLLLLLLLLGREAQVAVAHRVDRAAREHAGDDLPLEAVLVHAPQHRLVLARGPHVPTLASHRLHLGLPGLVALRRVVCGHGGLALDADVPVADRVVRPARQLPGDARPLGADLAHGPQDCLVLLLCPPLLGGRLVRAGALEQAHLLRGALARQQQTIDVAIVQARR